MGGFAVVIDWERRVDPDEVDEMMALVSDRTTGGVRSHRTEHAILAEGRAPHQASTEDWQLASLGTLTIAGDIRLLRRGRLRDHAGGHATTSTLDDRTLLLCAYERVGPEMLDAVDGDFAFVIWDEKARTALAVRDRFAVRGLFMERTPTGIRFACEPKQLAATSREPVALNDHIVAEYLTNTFKETSDTFFRGIDRIRASDALLATPGGERRIRYWTPVPDLDYSISPADVPHHFGELLTDSVRRRLAWADSSVAHLSGGLDSTTVVAAAQRLHAQNPDAVSLETVSAVYPGLANDESKWIDDLVALQPFPHHRFVPRIATTTQFDEDMWVRDHPWIDRDRDQWYRTTEIAQSIGATQVLTGVGGDHVLDQEWLLPDLLRGGAIPMAIAGARDQHAWSGERLSSIVRRSVAAATPDSWRRSVRRVIPRHQHGGHSTFASDDLLATTSVHEPNVEPMDVGAPTLAANALAFHARSPMAAWIMESHDAGLSRQGVDETNPYFDRALYEFVASIPPERYPLDGRSKVLARLAFEHDLPSSVLDRRTKTTANEYVEFLFGVHGREYRDRFPAVIASASGYIDCDGYLQALTNLDASNLRFAEQQTLWQAWTLMAFLEGLERYR